jgi:protein-S-isoprenylcysteine O-methyltransferase Ste14
MKRYLFLAYGVACHAAFLATYAAMAAFVANLFLPNTIDAPNATPLGQAVAVNLLLVLAFGLQHSIMARPAFKRRWTRFVPEPIERSTYVLASCLVTVLLLWQWQPIDVVVWDVQQPVLRTALLGLFAAGLLMVPLVSLMINHFDLFGTRQVWLYFKGQPYSPLPFRTPLLYARMRHPLYVGWAIAFWATPTMTVGHLLFAASLTAYMLLAVRVEERDLVAHFGERYLNYRSDVPMFVPRPASKPAPSVPAAAYESPST